MPQMTAPSVLQFLPRVLGLTLAVGLIGASPSHAQLTDQDISEMQKRLAAEGYTFEVGPSDATVYSLEQLCGLKEPPDWRSTARFVSFEEKGPIPPKFDWREKITGGMPPVRNQGGCGSCWAFSTVGALECAIKIQDGDVVDLSEQWLVSCNRHGWGCDGGWYAHDYHCWTKDQCDSTGAVLEQDYPYTASDAPCVCPDPHPYRIKDWAYVGPGDAVPGVVMIKQAIMQHGPVSVAVAVDGYFQAYQGGVFNMSTAQQINHAVVLVGWNDSLGASGAWIMRNSWGTNWGEDGYMYIAYGCDMIGYAATFVDYEGGISFSSDVQSGWAPFDVSFTGTSGITITDWSWDFGDGGSAAGQNAAHQYAGPGTYSVAVSGIDSLGQTRERERINYIMALADTVKSADTGGICNSCVAVPISIRNSVPVRYIRLPINYNGPVNLVLDSFSTAGCRTDYFERVSTVNADPANRRLTLQLISSDLQTAPYLEPGDGPVVVLYFSIPQQTAYGALTAIDLSGYLTYTPLLSWPLLDWTPVASAGSVTLAVERGDCDGYSGITVSDLTYLVNYMFRGGLPPVPYLSADNNCDQIVNVNDVTFMVGFLFRGGSEPAVCY